MKKYLHTALMFLLACKEAPAPPVTPPTIDIGDAIERVRLGFRAHSGELTARSRLWNVAVRDGEIALASASTVRFQTSSIQGRPTHPTVARIDARARVELSRGDDVVETIENSDLGVEQSWTFGTRPAREIVVRVRVDGANYVGATNTGLHFLDSSGGQGLRYGTASWIDASGQRTRLDPVWSNGEIEIVVPVALVSSSVYPATLDPFITPEISPDVPLTRSPDPGLTFEAPSAFGADVHLVVYVERVVSTATVGDKIFARRVRASDGVVLDPRPIEIASYDFATPAVAFDGAGNFLVVYNGTPPGSTSRVLGRRVRASDGAVLDARELVISTSAIAGPPRISFGSGRFLVTWPQAAPAGDDDVYGRLLDSSGAQIGASDTLIAGTASSERDPSVCETNGRFLVTYTLSGGSNQVRARRVDASTGAVLDVTPLNISAPTSFTGRCVTDGGNFLVVWSTLTGIFGARVDATTGAVDPTPTRLTNNPAGSVALSFDGVNYLMAWAEQRGGATTADVFAQRVSASLVPLDGPGGVAVSTSTTAGEDPASLTFGGGSAHLVSFRNDAHGVLEGRRLSSATLQPLDPTPSRFASQGNPQLDPAVAYGGGAFLLVWYDRRHEPPRFSRLDVVGVRIRPDGQILDPTPMTILADLGTAHHSPAVASDGTSFLVATYRPARSSPGDIVARRIRASDGAWLDANEVLVEPASMFNPPQDREPRVAVAHAAGRYVLAFPRFARNARFDILAPQVVTARIDATSGAVLAPSTVVLNDVFRNFVGQSIACATSSCLIVATDERAPYNTLGARVDPVTGALLDATPIDMRPGFVPLAESTALAFDGSSYLLAWHTHVGDLRVRSVSASGAIGPTDLLVAQRAWSEDVAFDGTHFVILWRSGPTMQTWQVRAARFLSPSTLVDAVPLFVGETGLTSEQRPRLASNGTGLSFMSHARMVFDPHVLTTRIVGRFLGNAPQGGACFADDGCLVGVCVDGVCCDAECGRGDPTDCIACSVAAGAAVDGVCGVASAATVCRAPGSLCAPVDYCDGTNVTCPPEVACPDAGTPDVGVLDDAGGLDDAGALDDASAADATPDDATATDSGPDDATPTLPDAMAAPDALTPDADSQADTRVLSDAGGPSDARVTADASETLDGGGGCGCGAASDTGSPEQLFGLLALLWAQRARVRNLAGRRAS